MVTKKAFNDGGRAGDESKAILFGECKRIPSIRFVKDMSETIYGQDWVKNNLNEPLYYMYRDLAKNEADAKNIADANLRFDILDSVVINLGKEYNKTAGHYHSMAHGTNFTYPEIYELINGEMYYLNQKVEGNKVIDVYAVRAESGDKVIVPSGYGHFSIFLSNGSVRESNWTSNSSISDYAPVKKMRGAAYYALIDKSVPYGVRWIKNENYSEVPPLRFLNVNNYKELGLKKEENMYGLVKDLSLLDYLDNPEKHTDLWNRIINDKA